MKVLLIGAGVAATTMALALRRAGVEVLGLHGRDRGRTARAARVAGVAATTGPVPAAASRADVIWILVSDDAIADVARTLAASGRVGPRQVVLHASGALGRELLSPLARVVAATGSLHPLQSLADPRRAAERLAGATFAVEGPPRALRAARALARQLGGAPVTIPPRGKALYHAAAVLTSGGTTALFAAAVDALSAAGLPRAQAANVLLPLLVGTVDAIARLGPRAALTGPVARGDSRTVELHREALARGIPRLAALYEALTEAQVRLRARRPVASVSARRRPRRAPGSAGSRAGRAGSRRSAGSDPRGR